MIKILNYKRETLGRAAGHCIMRGYSHLANPYPVKPWGPYERGETLPLYKNWLWNKYHVEKDPQVIWEINLLARKVISTGELRLVCCCFPLDCHGDVIAKLIEEVVLDKFM